jgi:hypothetical protein
MNKIVTVPHTVDTGNNCVAKQHYFDAASALRREKDAVPDPIL